MRDRFKLWCFDVCEPRHCGGNLVVCGTYILGSARLSMLFGGTVIESLAVQIAQIAIAVLGASTEYHVAGRC